MKPRHRPLRITATVVIAALGLAAAPAAQLFTVKVDPFGAPVESPSATFAAGGLACDTNPVSTDAWASAASGGLLLNCYVQTCDPYLGGGLWLAEATMRFDDLVFSSPTDAPITVTVRLGIDGGHYTDDYVGTGVTVELAGTVQSGTFSIDASGAPDGGTGLLNGWNGDGPFTVDSTHVSVPVNEPVTLKVTLGTVATAGGVGGTISNAFGGVGIGLSHAGSQPKLVFDVPTGVLGNSTQAGIVDNVHSASLPLQLEASSNPVKVTEPSPLELLTWNGEPGSLCGLFYSSVNGVPIFHFTKRSGTLDNFGRWETNPIFPPAAAVGLTVGFTSVALEPDLDIVISDEELVTFIL